METEKKCKWCLGMGNYEVFEINREIPVSRDEWKWHAEYLIEGLRYAKKNDDGSVRYGYPENLTLVELQEEKQKGIQRRGRKAPGIVVTYNELVRQYPNGEHRDVVQRSFAAQCHICSSHFHREHFKLVGKIQSCNEAKDYAGADLHRVDLARLWGK